MTHELPEGTAGWKNYAVKIDLTPQGSYYLQVYARERDGERWTCSALSPGGLRELGSQLAVALNQADQRGFERGLESVRVALGLPSGPARR